jgi:metal-responsive CopG/Arc/MetJ family transcriptional regulator
MNERPEKIETINVRLNSELINLIDSFIERGIYGSRSEFIREMCRNYVLEERKNEQTCK